MKNNYILTLRFSTNQPIDKLCGGKTFELIQEIGNAIRKYSISTIWISRVPT